MRCQGCIFQQKSQICVCSSVQWANVWPEHQDLITNVQITSAVEWHREFPTETFLFVRSMNRRLVNICRARKTQLKHFHWSHVDSEIKHTIGILRRVIVVLRIGMSQVLMKSIDQYIQFAGRGTAVKTKEQSCCEMSLNDSWNILFFSNIKNLNKHRLIWEFPFFLFV